ncbi:MAG: tetratricopeptide repeat protein, partial [Gammaproteobacteria bacterium]
MAISIISFAQAAAKRSLHGLSLLLTVFCLTAVFGAAPVLAQEGDEANEEEQSNPTGSMKEKTYRKLAEATELADAEDFAGARAVLDELKTSPKLTGYELAQIYNFYGYIYFAQDNYAASIDAYNTVLKQPDIPQGLRDATLYTLAQLYFTTEK